VKCLLHLLASYSAVAAALASEIHQVLFTAEVSVRSITVLPLVSQAMFALQSSFSFLGIPECPGTQWISVVMPSVRRLRALLLNRHASRCLGLGSRGAGLWIAEFSSSLLWFSARYKQRRHGFYHLLLDVQFPRAPDPPKDRH
jgi:hypothetical protein